MTLRPSNSGVMHQVELSLSRDTLSDHVAAQIVYQLDQLRQNLLQATVSLRLLDEAAIELDEFGRELPQPL